VGKKLLRILSIIITTVILRSKDVTYFLISINYNYLKPDNF